MLIKVTEQSKWNEWKQVFLKR